MDWPVWIEVYASTGSRNMDDQIDWTMVDNPDDEINSGDPIPPTNPQEGTSVMTYTFSSSTVPPVRVNGRTKPLSYQIIASIVSGREFNDKIIITQDNRDTLRQEYIDIIGTRPGPDRESPPDRTVLDQQTSATYPCLVNRFGTADGCTRDHDICEHHEWWMASGIIQHADDLDQAYAGALNVTSGYRCPARNMVFAGAADLSRHQWGMALDYIAANNQEYCDIFTEAIDNQNAGLDSYLRDQTGARHFHYATPVMPENSIRTY